MQLVETQGALNWVKISSLLGSRTPKQCRERYHQNLKPSLNHEPITPEEGELIERLVQQLGKRWAEIARRLHNRSDNAVKNWWNGSMNRRRRLTRKRAPYEDSSDTYPSYSRPPARLQLPAVGTAYSNSHYTQYALPSPTSSTSHYPQATWGPAPSLSSPSTAISPGTDSLTEAAPSLVSDAGSYYSESPTSYGAPESPELSLPPLRFGENKSPSRSNYTFDSESKPPAGQFALPSIRDALDGRTQLPTAPNSPATLPTPRAFHPTPRSPEPELSQPTDSRMKLNSILH
jgi:Myb-like DNA-binding protein FlbD